MSAPAFAPVALGSGRVREEARARERLARVALVISSLAGGGAERVLSGLAGHWVRSGRNVGVVTVASRETDAYELAPGVERVALGLLRPSRNPAEGLALTGRRAIALRRAIVAMEPDVVVSFMSSTNVLSLLAAMGTGIPVVVCERTDPRFDALPAPWVALRRLLYPLARAVVVQTDGVATWARELSRRVHVIPNFVEAPARSASPGVERGPHRLLAMGRLGPEKGFDLLIEAFALVARLHPDWSLTILGEGPERRRLQALAAWRRIEDRVSLPGRVADPVPHLAAARVFALSSRFEGFPNALLEAMACGLPAVAFDCPSGPSSIIAHDLNGILVPPGDIPRLAAALDRLMRSPAERARLGKNARDVTVAFAPRRILGLWSDLLKGLGLE